MPRQGGVYGKRSRAAYNPIDIFGSPQNLAPTAADDASANNTTLADATASLCTVVEGLTIVSPSRLRRPLSERDGNAVLPVKVRTKSKSIKEHREKTPEPQCVSPTISDPLGVLHETAAAQTRHQEEDIVVVEEVEVRGEHGNATLAVAPKAGLEEVELLDHRNEATEATILQSEVRTIAADAIVSAPRPNDIYTTHCAPLLDLTAHDICSFTDWASQLAEHFLLSKIAEASFGEVYRLSLRPDLPVDAATSTLQDQESVLKVIALKAPDETLPRAKRERERALKKAAAMSKPDDVVSEVRLLQRMTSIPGYTNFRDVRVLSGRPGEPFVHAWKDYNARQKAAKKDMSIFPDPAKKASYSDTQLWAVIEMQDAGTDLERLVESGECTDVWTIWDVFWQTVIALAKGEEAAEFEHRDLHLGNICVRHSEPDASQRDIDVSRTLGFTGTEATLIDYTISRASMAGEGDANGEVAFIDLSSDPHIFNGDSTSEYQYDIYRYMRNAVYSLPPTAPFPPQQHSDPTPWGDFRPVTNLVWLHYILYTLLEQIAWPSASKAPPRKKGKEWKQWKRANDLEFVLLKCRDLLEPFSNDMNGVSKSGDLVGLALEEGWLRDEDVIGAIEEEDMGERDIERVWTLVTLQCD